MPTLEMHYTPHLVIVSVLISIATSYAALSLSDRVRAAATAPHRRFWLTSGSVTMGFGIWSMHYLGMLALTLPVPVFYHWPTVLASLLLAVAGASVAFSIVSREALAPGALLSGGLLMGAGIGGMHYTGMAAMRAEAMEHYTASIVLLSVLAAVGFSALALWIAFAARTTRYHPATLRIAASFVMGLGIAAMHYIAMVGVRFTASSMPVSFAHTVRVDTLGQSVIAIITVLILILALGTATLDKWRYRDLQKVHADLMQAQSALLKTQEELREANAMLNELSVRDSLTDLYNRRHFDAAIATELSRAARTRKPVALLMIDVDCFKALNDGYGHQRGDDCLREIARILERQPRRGYDVLARYGGEEFVLLLPGADLYAAHALAESIRRAVQALAIENHGSIVCEQVTVSIGVCCQDPYVGGDSEELLRAADEALYTAKRLGRNRVESAPRMILSI